MSAPLNAPENTSKHIPVLLNEVVMAMSPKDGEVYVDGTFGAGGYTRAVLMAANCTVIAIDRDPDAIKRAEALKDEFGDRFIILEGCFGDMERLLAEAGISQVDGIMLDIGVSSFQLDEAERGFSFQKDGPLDMTMTQSGENAADVVNAYPEAEIADIIYKYGDEPKSRHIARAIVERRAEKPFERTLELADLIENVVGRPRPKKGKKVTHPATKSFQALRVFVNDELGELERALGSSERLLCTGGRLVVVSFHSLEDGMVKQFMAEKSGRVAGGSRHAPIQLESAAPSTFMLKKKSAIKPSKEEMERNIRARSSRLRLAVRTDVPSSGKGGVL
ncbi:16S rRNA (cytosine(1402)-N(4))-methyltransferase RsmH [Kordiimonas sp. SCSIO 12610]|uniref:16S rRNA (cytosine(1402)-N(4))-methyltransferase RsmH n=1 Tax=Kordiimonas sp. SCSIO 12610 TaxID=2829597 RepID=UPI00210B8B7A|nr:16S rRNA (cytosine(1402)-N(4))-methyltransferase RsmH [Kordiimonas sp. SCSIO 12610]UTW56403.1 16S rRNA (cytosine(1402)-N(4))-methyltransferase RsmH [Kordiimonas sp. SCSIO 12610]